MIDWKESHKYAVYNFNKNKEFKVCKFCGAETNRGTIYSDNWEIGYSCGTYVKGKGNVYTFRNNGEVECTCSVLRAKKLNKIMEKI